MKVLVQVSARNLKAPCSTCLGTCGPSARGEDLVMYYNVLLFLLFHNKAQVYWKAESR
jgi:hypothetical protein